MRGGRKSAIRLGLVHVPVQTPSAVDSTRETRTEFVAPSGQKAEQVYVDPATGEKLEREQLQRGVKVGGEYAIVPEEQWEAITEATKPDGIQVHEFTDPETLEVRRDRIRDTHFVQPQAGAGRSLALLRKAMLVTGKVAVVTWGAGTRQRLGVLRVREDGGMEILTLRSEAEVRQPDEDVLAVATLEFEDDSPELKMATDLIESMSNGGEFLDQWQDDAVERRNALIEEVAAGGEVAVPDKAPEPTKAPDLMAQLQAEVEKRKKPPRKPAKKGAKKGRAKAAARA